MLTRIRLKLPGEIGWTVLQVALDEQVNVVLCNLQGENLVTEVVGSLRKQLSHIVLHYIENRVSILRTLQIGDLQAVNLRLTTPHEVILAVTNRMCMTSVLLYP